jgi:hypothetical protein
VLSALIAGFEGWSPALKEGERCAVRTPWGDTWSGRVVRNEPGRQFACTVEELDDAFLRVMAERGGGKTCAWVWVGIWGPRAAFAGALEERMKPFVSKAAG